MILEPEITLALHTPSLMTPRDDLGQAAGECADLISM
jgi:hypothetical protein